MSLIINTDTADGIRLSLSSLELFNLVLRERQEAGYTRNERMNEFLVMGRWLLDTCGNCMEIIGEPLEGFVDVYDLSYGRPDGSYSFKNRIPPSGTICPECGEKWNIDRIWECRVEHSDIIISGKDYDGVTIEELKFIFKHKSDGLYMFRKETSIRNDKHIDKTLTKYGTETNKNGWVEVDDSYVIKNTDDISCTKYVFYHASCLKVKTQRHVNELISGEDIQYDRLKNLAGDENCDIWIRAEMEYAGIKIVDNECRGEVPTKLIGHIGNNDEFKYTRAWSYWVVSGNVPLSIAKEIYATDIGSKYVRINGDCGCVAPEECRISYIDDDGKKLCSKSELEKYKDSSFYESLLNSDDTRWVDDPTKEGKPYITSYHIDTLSGLKLFVDKIKMYGVNNE